MKIKKPVSRQLIPKNAKKVFKGVIFDVYQWQQKGYDGKYRTFEKLKRPDTAMIIPVTQDGKIIIAKEQQPGTKPNFGLVGGRIDKGESPLSAAKRELLEETGYKAKEWILFDATQPVSKIEWIVYAFVARGCYKVAEQNLDGAEKIEISRVNFEKFLEIAMQKSFGEPELKSELLEAKLNPSKMAELKKQLGL